eukprot:TRINITY_DN43216_c0_g1_i1.p1 TRINITY_DN43216_c0_g1~~TRINITY_DN43216_c0_g1_i1.p1  ORF type:complete len:305 (+),score=81.73 TRINITY_DN43216_c0_g1_i1:66-917(+)
MERRGAEPRALAAAEQGGRRSLVKAERAARQRWRLRDFRQERYRADAKEEDPAKREVNALFAAAAGEALRRAARPAAGALVLDGAELRTSRALAAVGYAPGAVHVPNPFVGADEWSPDLPGGTPVVHRRLAGELIADPQVALPPLAAVWLDYCCGWHGDPVNQVWPAADVAALFRSSRLHPEGAVVAVTVQYCHTPARWVHQTLNEVVMHLQDQALQSGAVARLLPWRIYGGMLYAAVDCAPLPPAAEGWRPRFLILDAPAPAPALPGERGSSPASEDGDGGG